jgi:hypothetical protein
LYHPLTRSDISAVVLLVVPGMDALKLPNTVEL